MTLTRVLLFVAISLCTLQATAQADETDDLVLRLMEEYRIPGVAIAVVKENEVIKASGYGTAVAEHDVPVTPDTVFPVASMTKSFGGLAIMMLVEEGKLFLDQSITDVLSDIPDEWNPITIRHLLTHTSGLPDIFVGTNELVAPTLDESWEQIKEMPLMFQPGEKWEYIQSNYLAVGRIITQLTGKTFAEYVHAYIAQPLELSSVYFGGIKTFVPNRASVYQIDDTNEIVPYLDWVYLASGVGAAAGINMSANDFAKFCIATAKNEFINQESFRSMGTPVKLNTGMTARFRNGTLGYGCGWAEFLYPGHVAYGHDGGGICVFNYFPDDDLSIIVLSNLIGPKKNRPPTYEILEGLARIYIKDFMTFTESIQRFATLMNEEHDQAAAIPIAQLVVKDFPDHAQAMNFIAWTIASAKDTERKNLILALEAATRANELTEHQQPAFLDSLAKVYFELGNVAAAINWQEKAASLAKDDESSAEIRARLEEYRAAVAN